MGRPGVLFVNVFDKASRVWTAGHQPAEEIEGGRCALGERPERRLISLRPDTPPGYYWVEYGLVDPVTKHRLPIVGPDGQVVDRLVAGPVRVKLDGLGDERPAHELEANLGGEIRLLGWTAEPRVARLGEGLRITLHWSPQRAPAGDYNVFVHMYDPHGKLIAQHDGPPGLGAWPTSSWQPGDSLADEHTLQLPGSFPEGEYVLAAGMYNLATMQRLSVRSGPDLGDSRVRLGSIRVGEPR